MKVLVCGGRDYDEWPKLKEKLDELHETFKFTEVIHGAAQGADRLAGVWSRWNNIKESPYPADWKKDGKRAGYVRNARMLKEGKPELIIAFKGGKGTQMMIKLAEDSGVEVYDLDRRLNGQGSSLVRLNKNQVSG